MDDTKAINAMIAKAAASQGMVLLENRNNALPLNTKKIALFGGGAYATVKGGTGSGNVSNPYNISIYEGFINAGYTITSAKWIENFKAHYSNIQSKNTSLSYIQKIWSGLRETVPDPSLIQEDILAASDADTAIYVISRSAGEGIDRNPIKGDYYLTDEEEANLHLIAKNFKTSIVILNTCVMDTKFFVEIEGLDALVIMSQAGMEGGAALVDVLSGIVTPSGKLSDTWAKNYNDYPASKTFGENDGDSIQENYEEGIYVGYRYFDSFNITPAYEFGYGLSYTDFIISINSVTLVEENISVQVHITNIGDKYSGKEVIQIYFSAPQGEVDKPYQELIAFGKTDDLAPQQSQIISISFPLTRMASYNEKLAAYIMEKGDYFIRVGNSSRNTKVSAIIRMDETKIIEQLSNQIQLDQHFHELTSHGVSPYQYDTEEKEISLAPVIEVIASSITTQYNFSRYEAETITTYLPEGSEYKSSYKPGSEKAIDYYTENIEYVRAISDVKLYDVYTGKIRMEEFVANLDIKTLATLVNGVAAESDYSVNVEHPITGAVSTPGRASGATTGKFINAYGIPNTVLADGPAGLHVPQPVSEDTVMPVEMFTTPTASVELAAEEMLSKLTGSCTAFPVGILLAQSWDIDLMRMVGEAFGREMLEKNITIVLAPGMNIHRDPMCGRNFEYYSEDPLITGMMGANFTLGVQSYPGIGVSIKHFAANNQEANRLSGNSSVSERALREIYLKGFEIAVKSAQPMTVMTSYNKINGIHTSNRFDLCTHILRGEWGFTGYVTTDWGSIGDNAISMHAGNDMIMGGSPISDITNAILAPQPVFNADGSIAVTKVSYYSGVKTEEIENWNSFRVRAGGDDKCSILVAADAEISEKVLSIAEKGAARVIYHKDGTKTVEYCGKKIEPYITLGDLQKSAMNLLKVLLKSWNVKFIYNESTGYTPIDTKPFNDGLRLVDYLWVIKS